jgi:hypothetical protein
MLGVWVQRELEIRHRVAAIGAAGDRLGELLALRLEHREEPPLRLLVIALDEGNAFAGDGRVGLLTPREGQQALPGDALTPAWRALGPDVPAIAAHRQGTMAGRYAAPCRGTARDHRPRFLPQGLRQAFADFADVLPPGEGMERRIKRQDVLPELRGDAIGR